MRLTISAALIGLSLAISGAFTAWAANLPRITLMSASTHKITASTGPKCNSRSTVSFKMRVTGIKLSASMKTKSPRKGQGHIQAYLDKVPADAYSKRDLRHWYASIPSPKFPLCFPLPLLGGKKGKHTLYLGLGKTNSILYKTKPAKFTFTAK
jgi:hypothetical protein